MTRDWRRFPPLDLPPILRVALGQFVRHGYDATTVRTIAREVGVTVPALYYHFANKQAILVELLDRAMTTVSDHVDGAMAQTSDDPADRLRAMVEVIVLYMTHHREYAQLDSERRALTAENFAHYTERRDLIERQLRGIIEDGCARGAFATPVPHTCGRAILTMCQGVAGWYRPEGPRSPEEIAREYIRIALAAVEYGQPR